MQSKAFFSECGDRVSEAESSVGMFLTRASRMKLAIDENSESENARYITYGALYLWLNMCSICMRLKYDEHQ